MFSTKNGGILAEHCAKMQNENQRNGSERWWRPVRSSPKEHTRGRRSASEDVRTRWDCNMKLDWNLILPLKFNWQIWYFVVVVILRIFYTFWKMFEIFAEKKEETVSKNAIFARNVRLITKCIWFSVLPPVHFSSRIWYKYFFFFYIFDFFHKN